MLIMNVRILFPFLRLSRFTIIVFLLIACLSSSLAATCRWNTTGAGNWNEGANWDGGVPGAGDDAVITNVGASVSLTNSTASLNSLTISNASLVFSNWNTALSAETVTIQTNGMMTCIGPFTNNAMSNRVYIICSNMTIDAGGSINVNTNGYSGGYSTNFDGHGPGGGRDAVTSTNNAYACGAAYGGRGGTSYLRFNWLPGCLYGLPNEPIYPGSGGSGLHSGAKHLWGGHGGGAVRIQASGAVTINGIVTADGGGPEGGGGSGGSIYITCNTFAGSNGILSASETEGRWCSGGGGRVAVMYDTNAQAALPVPNVQFHAETSSYSVNGGWPWSDIGTIYFPDTRFLSETITNINGQLIFSNAALWSVDSLTISNCWIRFPQEGFRLTVSNDLRIIGSSARLDLGGSVSRLFQEEIYLHCRTSAPSLNVGGNLILTNSAKLFVYSAMTNAGTPDYGALVSVTGDVCVASNSCIYPWSHPTNGGSVYFRSRNLRIDRYGGINADGTGFAGPTNHTYLGYGPGAGYWFGGGGYGGTGGTPSSGKSGGPIYGSSNAPNDPGSSSGVQTGMYVSGQSGGGLVRILALDTIAINGTITAKGNSGSYSSYATGPKNCAGGSGGGIYLRCRTFSGSTNGILRANGGGKYSAGGGGGGGRIAVWRASDIDGFGVISNYANRGEGTYGDEDGTIVWGGLPALVTDPTQLIYSVTHSRSTNLSFQVWNAGPDTNLVYYTITSTNISQMTLSPSIGTLALGQTNTIAVTNTATNLAVGVYTGMVTIASTNITMVDVDPWEITIPVLLTVDPKPPYLNVSPTNLTRTIIEGQNASTQTFEVWNSSQNDGGDFYEMTYTNAVNTNWLSVTPSFGVSQGEHDTIDVIYNTTNLTASTNAYTTTIRVDGTNLEYSISAENSPQYVQVSVLVQGSPTLALTPAGLTNTVSQGHKASAQDFRVWNSSAEPRVDLEYTMSVDAGGAAWITLTPTNGTCKDNTNTVSVTYNTESLSSGWHTGVVTVASAGSTQTVGVLMRVNATPVVSWDMTGWTNEISEGETVSAGSFEIWNGSAQPSGTLKYELSDNMTWVSLSKESGTSTGGHDTVTVTYSTAGISAGVYTGAITAAGTDEATGDTAQGSPKSVGLKLTVKGRAALRTSVNGITNTVLENYTETNTFTLWNGSGTPRSPMAYTVTDDATWLSVSPSSGTVTDGTNTITVVFFGGTLSTGTYTGTITVDATDMLSGARATNAPKTIAVTMIITPRTPSNYELPAIMGRPYAGQTLNVDKGLWQNKERLSFTYQWQKADDSAGTGLADIESATSTNLVVSQDDRGKYLRIKVLATDSEPWPLSATVYSAFTDVMKVRAVKGDFDSDGLTDLWFFDAIPGIWRMAYSGGGAGKLEFGNFYMEAAPGDYDGNGILDFCTYEQAEGTWYVLLRPSYELRSARFGWSETKPVEGDYDGDGTTDIAVYWPEGGIWYILKSSTWEMEWTQFGWSETEPVPGDYDGDGATDLGLYLDGTWYIWTAKGDYWTDEFGSSKALSAPGDYDGDGITDLGVYWPSDNKWHMQISSTGEIREEEFGTSNGACIPMQGYYDHDRQCDPATVHIERDFLIWCVKRSTGGYRGQSYQVSTDRWRVSW